MEKIRVTVRMPLALEKKVRLDQVFQKEARWWCFLAANYKRILRKRPKLLREGWGDGMARRNPLLSLVVKELRWLAATIIYR